MQKQVGASQWWGRILLNEEMVQGQEGVVVENSLGAVSTSTRELPLRGPWEANSYCWACQARNLAKRKQVGSRGEECQRKGSRQEPES